MAKTVASNEEIENSPWWKRMNAIWGPSVAPLPKHVKVLHLPATNPHEEGGMQSGPPNVWKDLSIHEEKRRKP